MSRGWRLATRGSRLAVRSWLFAAGLLLLAENNARAHPAPFSYLDIHLSRQSFEGTLILHDFDVAHELGVRTPDDLLDPDRLHQEAPRISRFVAGRLQFVVDGRAVPLTVVATRPLPDRNAIELAWRTEVSSSPGHVAVRGVLFPYDPSHQTFVNIYENGRLARQHILDDRAPALDYYPGTRQGAWAVFKAFTASGIHHIAIGPDHIFSSSGSCCSAAASRDCSASSRRSHSGTA